MSRKEFMEELKVLLSELPVEEREEAIRYYESYFEEAGAEQEQAVLTELGSAGRIASQIIRDYHMENGGGIYTEQGYAEQEKEKQTPVRYEEENQKEQAAGESRSQGIYVTNKGLGGGAWVVIILAAVLTFPIWISILGVAFGLLMGFFGAAVGIVCGFGFGGIGCIIGGVAAFAVGIFKAFTLPVVGAGLIAAGLLLFGVGCLMIAAAGGMVRLAIWIVNGLIKFFSRLFHGKRGAAV